MTLSTAQRPHKVLHVFNAAGGGAALSTLGLIEAFRGEGIEACAVCHDSGTHAERECIRDATRGEVLFTPLYWWNRKIRSPLWKRPLAELKQGMKTGWSRSSARRVAEFAMAHSADLIHSNTLTTPEGGLAARTLGLPHVWHVRELVGPNTPYPLALAGSALGRYLVEHSSKVIANSAASAAPLRPLVPEELLEVVPNGIDISRFHPRQSRHSERVVVAMVGNLTSHVKKHGLFVDAASRVSRDLPIEWRIYGHDPSRGGTAAGDAYVERLHAQIARAGLAERFRWPGFVTDPTRIMDEIDILVHPADQESFGRVVVEAMAAALPVVGVRGGGVGEIVSDGQTGLLARPDDAADLAAAIERLARDTAEREAFGRAGRQRAVERFSLAACAGGVLRVYEQAMSRPLGRSRLQATLTAAAP